MLIRKLLLVVSLGFNGWRDGGDNGIHPLKNGELGRIARALAKFENTSVTAPAILESGCNILEQDFCGTFLMEARHGEAAMVDGSLLAERDHLFSNGTGGLGLGQGRRDALVFNQAANEVGKHRIAMFGCAAQFGRALQMSHGNSLFGFNFFLRRVHESRFKIHTEREAEGSQFVFDFVE